MTEERAFLDAVEMGLRGEDPPVDTCGETTEPEHAHVCPACGDSWLHRDSECEYIAVEIVPGYPINRTWARCPMHEGRDE